jgi:uncharacterized protein (UPF0261 family)
MMKNILLIGTLDTKGEEIAFLRDQIRHLGMNTMVMDLGILGIPVFEGDISRRMVLEKVGVDLADLQDGNKREDAINAAIQGGQLIVAELYEKKAFDGVIALGGGSGTSMGSRIMRTLPIGFPKCLVTTLSNLTQFLGSSDICIMYSMVDLVGLNSLTRTIIQEAAAAIVGMVENRSAIISTKPCVAITCLGVTTPCVMKVRERLLKTGREVVVLHFYTHVADELAKLGLLEAMLDLTPSELTRGLIYPDTTGMPQRLEAVRRFGIPLIVAPGSLDMLLHSTPLEKVPEALLKRRHVVHSPNMTLLQTTAQERGHMGTYIATQLHESCGQKAILIPSRGFSMWDQVGKAFHDPVGIEKFTTSVKAEADSDTAVIVSKGHINDDEFVDDIMKIFEKISKVRNGETV